ncbi:hypothetical protein ABFS83_05G082000 [Erythranthe nasuta]
MDTPSANSELDLQLNTSQLNANAAAWHVLGLLLSHGGPARPSDLASSFTLLYPNPEFIRFLCSIPNSPLRLADNHFVTFSQIGFAAIAHFFANSDVITRCLDLPDYVPRLLATNVRSSNIVRTYCRKRKRLMPEIEDLPQMKKKSYFQVSEGEMNLNQAVMKMPPGFQRLSSQFKTLQGSGTLSRFSMLSEYDSCILEKNMFRPSMLTEFSSGQFGSEIEKHEHDNKEFKFPKLEDCGYYLSEGTLPRIHETVAEERMNSAPLLELSLLNQTMGDSEGIKFGDIGIVNPTNSMNICTSPKVEVDGQMLVSPEENDAVTQGCESLTEDVNGKRKEVLLHESGGCRGRKENQPMDSTYKDNSEKSRCETNKEAVFMVRPRIEVHLHGQGDMLNDLTKHSSLRKSNNNDETNSKRKSIDPTTENCKCRPDKEKKQTSEKLKIKCNCDRNMNTKEKKELSTENRKKDSSIINNNIEKKPFPDFEQFIVEEEEGSGGYGTVYRARRKTDGVTFAIKSPHANANRNYVHNEMKMLERLGGKNFVIKYEGSFTSESGDCFVLEHVEHDRPEILKKEITIMDLQWYGYCLFKALAGLHKQGIVHRDIKPGNFLYSRKVNKGYLIDFNLALDMRKKFGITDNTKSILKSAVPIDGAKSVLPMKSSKKLVNGRSQEAVNKNAGKASKSLLPPGNLKRKVDKAKGLTDNNSKRNIIRSQGGDGSGITCAKDGTSNRTPSAERLREPLPSQGRKELLSLAQEAMQGGGYHNASLNSPTSKRKRVAAPPVDADTKFLYPTPMPLHANGIAIRGAGLPKSKGDGKHKKESPCAGTKGFKAPEVLFRSMYQGPKADIWSAGVTLLYLIIGRPPFSGDTDQNIKEIAKLRGSEDLWEVAKLHDHESLFPTELLDVKYLSPVKLGDWCARNTRRPDFLDSAPRSLLDLVDKCLMVNPRHRITAEEALRHDFFKPCHEAFRKHRLLQQHGENSLVS